MKTSYLLQDTHALAGALLTEGLEVAINRLEGHCNDLILALTLAGDRMEDQRRREEKAPAGFPGAAPVKKGTSGQWN